MVKFKTKRLFSLQKGKEEKRSSIYLLLQAKICRDCSVIQKKCDKSHFTSSVTTKVVTPS